VTEGLTLLVERLVRDLDPAARVEWTVEPRTITAALVIDGARLCAAGVPDDKPVVAAAMQIVDLFQDAVIERLGGRAVPACPVAGHPHPAALRPDGDGAAWRCPAP
jgi:hypothetical protein